MISILLTDTFGQRRAIAPDPPAPGAAVRERIDIIGEADIPLHGDPPAAKGAGAVLVHAVRLPAEHRGNAGMAWVGVCRKALQTQGVEK